MTQIKLGINTEERCFQRLGEIYPQTIPYLSHPLRPYPNNGPTKDDGAGDMRTIVELIYRVFCYEWDNIEKEG